MFFQFSSTQVIFNSLVLVFFAGRNSCLILVLVFSYSLFSCVLISGIEDSVGYNCLHVYQSVCANPDHSLCQKFTGTIVILGKNYSLVTLSFGFWFGLFQYMSRLCFVTPGARLTKWYQICQRNELKSCNRIQFMFEFPTNSCIFANANSRWVWKRKDASQYVHTLYSSFTRLLLYFSFCKLINYVHKFVF